MASLKNKAESRFCNRESLALVPDKENSPNYIWVAHALSIDHKPDNAEERERI
jgi:hypothetical protein